jgi:23S rRNA (guanine1835-N2)-methyltransferase
VSTSTFKTPYGEFALSRYPSRKNETLLAWCAADLLLLEEAHRIGARAEEILVAGDTHGAICVALQPLALWTDSALTVAGLRANEALNGRSPTNVHWSTDTPPASAIVLLRIPKQLDYLKYQLALLANILPQNGVVIAAGMDKHLSHHTAELLEQFIGPTQRHRGSRKARVFTATYTGNTDKAKTTSPPRTSYFCQPLEAELEALPNVFSRASLDLGSKLLLQHLPTLQGTGAAAGKYALVVDLACGNGALGLVAHHAGIAPATLFCDESALALESARLNASRLFPDDSNQFHFHHGDGLQGLEKDQEKRLEKLLAVENSQDSRTLVLCNPPFHLEHTVDDFVGRRLITQSGKAMKTGDHLLLVANRHLNYTRELQQHFSRVDTVARDKKFNLYLSVK